MNWQFMKRANCRILKLLLVLVFYVVLVTFIILLKFVYHSSHLSKMKHLRDSYSNICNNTDDIPAYTVDPIWMFSTITGMPYKEYITWLNKSCQEKNRQKGITLPLCTCWDFGEYTNKSELEDWCPLRSKTSPSYGELELKHRELQPGGAWSPPKCTARYMVAIIVPFSDRDSHLRLFLSVIHPFLQRQNIGYRIIVVEHAITSSFNKASMMNIGFVEASKMAAFDCFIFHDVDMLPENYKNIYICSDQPRHVGSNVDQFAYSIKYDEIFGGATAFTKDHFIRINGFSNKFFGWGGEDDDIYKRVVTAGMTIVRYPGKISRYHMIRHKADKKNPGNPKRFSDELRNAYITYKSDGLNSLKYTKLKFELRPLYTWILAKLYK